MGKRIPGKFNGVDNEGRQVLRDILVDEDTNEEVQPDDVKLSAFEKPPEKKGK